MKTLSNRNNCSTSRITQRNIGEDSLSEQNSVRCLRLALETDSRCARHLIGRTRQLFSERVQITLAAFLSESSFPGRRLEVQKVVVNLGVIPEIEFESEFCRRLVRQLPAELRKQLRSVTAVAELTFKDEDPNLTVYEKGDVGSGHRDVLGNSEKQPLFNDVQQAITVLASYLSSAAWSENVSPDKWLVQRLQERDVNLAWLAEICLQLPEIGVPGRYFKAATLSLLSQKLAPGMFKSQPILAGNIPLAALLWYQHQVDVPVPAVPLLTRPTLLPWRKAFEQYLSMSDIVPQTSDAKDITQRFEVPGADISGLQQVSHAGLCLLWPLLPELLQVTGIRQEDEQIDEQRLLEAVTLLVYLAEGEMIEVIPCTTFSHWLCGVSPEQTHTIVPLSAEKAEKVEQWLQKLPERIPGWQRLSGQDIRMLFLQREGWLCHDSNTLYLSPQPADILLAQWPWPLTILLLPWLQTPLTLSLNLPPQK